MERRFDARALNRRPLRPAVVASVLGAIAATVLWVAMIVTMFWAMATLDASAALFGLQAILVVVGAPFLWLWWRELLQPPVYPEPPDELGLPPRGHVTLGSDDPPPPPTRW